MTGDEVGKWVGGGERGVEAERGKRDSELPAAIARARARVCVCVGGGGERG